MQAGALQFVIQNKFYDWQDSSNDVGDLQLKVSLKIGNHLDSSLQIANLSFFWIYDLCKCVSVFFCEQSTSLYTTQ